jgi:hypothetical protein
MSLCRRHGEQQDVENLHLEQHAPGENMMSHALRLICV